MLSLVEGSLRELVIIPASYIRKKQKAIWSVCKSAWVCVSIYTQRVGVNNLS